MLRTPILSDPKPPNPRAVGDPIWGPRGPIQHRSAQDTYIEVMECQGPLYIYGVSGPLWEGIGVLRNPYQ